MSRVERQHTLLEQAAEEVKRLRRVIAVMDWWNEHFDCDSITGANAAELERRIWEG